MPVDTTIAPSRPEFLRLAATHSLVPVYRTLTADLETPVSAFLRLASDEPQSFLLESVEGGEKVGRYTFIGVRPYRTILSRGKSIVINERGKSRTLQGDVFALLKELLAGQKPAHIAGLPPFTCGAVGFFAYDVVRQLERLPELAEDDLGVPDACLMFFDEVLAFDHVRKQIQLMVTADLGRQKPAAAYADAKQRLDQSGEAPGKTHSQTPARSAPGQTFRHQPHPEERLSRLRRQDQGVHRRRRHLPGRAVAAL